LQFAANGEGGDPPYGLSGEAPARLPPSVPPYPYTTGWMAPQLHPPSPPTPTDRLGAKGWGTGHLWPKGPSPDRPLATTGPLTPQLATRPPPSVPTTLTDWMAKGGVASGGPLGVRDFFSHLPPLPLWSGGAHFLGRLSEKLFAHQPPRKTYNRKSYPTGFFIHFRGLGE